MIKMHLENELLAMKKIGIVLLGLILILASCKDQNVNPSDNGSSINPLDTITNFTGLILPKEGSIQLNFSHVFAGSPLQLNTGVYVNAAGDSFNVEDLRYYFTNLSLQKQSGEWINLKNYQLIDFKSPSTHQFTINKVPAGYYQSVRFLLGVDSLNNSSGLQEGALDPAWGMFWTWNTGYIFYRIMGRNPNTSKTYSFDIGGNENLPIVHNDIRTFKIKSQNPKLFLEMDVNEMFQNPSVYSFEKDGYAVHTNTSTGAWKLAMNMSDMVQVKVIEQ